MVNLIPILVSTSFAGGDLSTIAREDGYKALAREVRQASAEDLEHRGLSELRFPVEVRGSAAESFSVLSTLQVTGIEEGFVSAEVSLLPRTPDTVVLLKAGCLNNQGDFLGELNADLMFLSEPFNLELVAVEGLERCWRRQGSSVMLYAAGDDPDSLLQEEGLAGEDTAWEEAWEERERQGPTPARPAPVQPGDSVVLGGMDRAEVNDRVYEDLDEVGRCYAEARREQPELAGSMKVRFKIDATGEVSQAELSYSNLRDPELNACVVRLFEEMVFPTPRTGRVVIVTYPLQFSPDAGE